MPTQSLRASFVLGSFFLFACGGSALFSSNDDGGGFTGAGGDLNSNSTTGMSDTGTTTTTSSNGNGTATAGNGTGPSASAANTTGAGTSGSAGSGGAPSTTNGAGTSTATATTGSGATATATSGATTSTSTAATSSSSGGMTTCAHDICVQGPALASNCDPCVTTICNNDPFCCASNGAWDEICQAAVFNTCKIDCNPGQVPCEQQYNANQSGYFACVQGIDECSFGHNMNQNGSCASFCAKQGGECLNAFNDNNNKCGYGQQLNCNSTGFNTAICVCSRGCGTGKPCGSGKQCVNGQCI